MPVSVKICGLSSIDAVAAAVDGGAAMVGFVFFERSPRAISANQLGSLVADVPATVTRVGLFVDATEDAIAAAVATGGLDMLQLHGNETADDVVRLKQRFGLPVMTAVGVSCLQDLDAARTYEPVVDRLLFDARPPKEAGRPGGNAQAFDWHLMKAPTWNIPWMLAGGLTAENLAEAVQISGADAVDVSSGVEDGTGHKSITKIRDFLNLAASL